MPLFSPRDKWSLVTAVCAVIAPFLLGASGVVLIVGGYRMARPGPRGTPASFASGWEIISSAWPLFLTAIAFTAAGLYGYRKMLQKTPGTPAPQQQTPSGE